MSHKSFLIPFIMLAMFIASACTREIRTVDDLVRTAGNQLMRADLWQANVSFRLNRPTHISEWEGIIYSDGTRYAAIVNGASAAGRLQSHLVIDGEGRGWLRTTDSGSSEVLKFDPHQATPTSVGPESFVLPGNPATGNPLGMFLDPARALQILSTIYDLRLTRRTHVDGDPVLGFTGTIKPNAMQTIDPDRYLVEHNMPIQNVDITVRLYDGAPRRIQFMDQGIGYLLIEYSDFVIDPEPVDSRFEFDPNGAEVKDITERGLDDAVAGVNEYHVLFEWDETRRVLPRAD